MSRHYPPSSPSVTNTASIRRVPPSAATGSIPRVRLPHEEAFVPERGTYDPGAPDALHHEYVGDWGYRPIVPERAGGGGRTYLLTVFWFGLATACYLWWLDTPAHSVHGFAEIMAASGRITGMVAGYTLLVQVLLMSRAGWLERTIGAHDLLIWHRAMGATVVLTVTAHVVLITIGYAGESHTSVISQTVQLWHGYPAMISAYVAAGILAVVCLLSIRAVRRRMAYELWYYVHLSAYLVLLWSYGHEFADGQELAGGGFGHWFWVSLYVVVVASLVRGRIINPLTLNARHRFRVQEVVPEANDMVSLYITGRRLEDLDARAGQFFRWRFMARGCWWQAHPFSLSAAPNGRWLRLTVKMVGDHTRSLVAIRPGTRIIAEGPWGVFTAEHRRKPTAVLIAGGSGIAPIRALLEELPPGTVVIYRARDAAEILFRDELEWLARERQADLWYVLGGRDDSGPRRAFSPAGMRELAPDIRHRDVYLCGPPGLVDSTIKALRKLRVPRKHLHMDPFEY